MGVGGDGEPRRPDHARVGDVVERGDGHGVRQAEGPPGFFLFVPCVVSFRRRRQRRVAYSRTSDWFFLPFPGGIETGLHNGPGRHGVHLLRKLESLHGFLDLLRAEACLFHGFPVFFDLPEVILSKHNLIQPRRIEDFFRDAEPFSGGKAVDMADPRPDFLRKAHPPAIRRGRTKGFHPQHSRQNSRQEKHPPRSFHAVHRVLTVANLNLYWVNSCFVETPVIRDFITRTSLPSSGEFSMGSAPPTWRM